jgi:hypothetical protein
MSAAGSVSRVPTGLRVPERFVPERFVPARFFCVPARPGPAGYAR